MNSALYDPQEYIFHPSLLDKPRKLGLSGVLVTRADSLTVGAAIDSCVSVIDELVIIHHKPMNENLDGTGDILERKRKEYPDKIRIYSYKAEIHHQPEGYKLGEITINRSIHSFSNLVNYGLSKTVFSHYLCVDGDHLFFQKSLKAIHQHIVNRKPIKDVFGEDCDFADNSIFYTPHINLTPSFEGWYVSTEQRPGMEIFSGIGDHIIHPICSSCYYLTTEKLDGRLEYNKRLITCLDQTIKENYKFHWLGFFSWHLKHVVLFKRYGNFKQKIPHLKRWHDEVFIENKDIFLPVGDFLKLDFARLNLDQILWMKKRLMAAWGSRFDVVDLDITDLISKDEIEKILSGYVFNYFHLK